MIKTLIMMILMGMPFASLNTAGLTLQETPVQECVEPAQEETVEYLPEEYHEDISEELTQEEMYQLNYDSYEDEDSEVWYDVPTESCPGHEYVSTNAYNGEYYFVAHYCPYCGDYYETPLTEQEYDVGTAEGESEVEEPPEEDTAEEPSEEETDLPKPDVNLTEGE